MIVPVGKKIMIFQFLNISNLIYRNKENKWEINTLPN